MGSILNPITTSLTGKTSQTTYPKHRSLAPVAGLGKVGLVALLTEDLLVLEDERGAVQLFVAAAAHKVFRMPHTPHGAGKWTPAGRRRGGGGCQPRSPALLDTNRVAEWSIVCKNVKPGNKVKVCIPTCSCTRSNAHERLFKGRQM